jgi:hypothetical protein
MGLSAFSRKSFTRTYFQNIRAEIWSRDAELTPIRDKSSGRDNIVGWDVRKEKRGFTKVGSEQRGMQDVFNLVGRAARKLITA